MRCLKLAIAIRENTLGQEHPEVAALFDSLAEVHQADGKLDDAKECSERALDIYMQALGPDHPDALEFLEKFEQSYPDH
jgi:hypothetical protein